MKNRGTNNDIYDIIGGLEGLRSLSNTFYDIMDSLPEAQPIRDMHPENLDQTRENLSLFMSGWLGGPPLYKKEFGSVNLTSIHSPFDIDSKKRELWLTCMEKAIEQHPIPDDVKQSLLNRFQIPAKKIQEFCQQRPAGLITIE